MTAKSWLFRYSIAGHRTKTGKTASREMGLGSLSALSLADARERATECRKSLRDGVDPIEEQHNKRRKTAADRAKVRTFKWCAERYIAAHRAGWRNAVHAKQWPSTLETYVYPTIGSLHVHAIDTPLVLAVLEPIWTTKPETAGRVRGRIEAILDWAKVSGLRSGENPARWKGHLDHLLPARGKVRKVKRGARARRPRLCSCELAPGRGLNGARSRPCSTVPNGEGRAVA